MAQPAPAGSLTEAEVRARILTFTNPSEEPVLTSADLDILIYMSKIIDYNGVWPTMTGWIESYNYNLGIALGWLIKATRIADRYLFMDGGTMLSRNQYYDHCMMLYHRFANKAGPSGFKLVADRHLALMSIENNADVNATYA